MKRQITLILALVIVSLFSACKKEKQVEPEYQLPQAQTITFNEGDPFVDSLIAKTYASRPPEDPDQPTSGSVTLTTVVMYSSYNLGFTWINGFTANHVGGGYYVALTPSGGLVPAGGGVAATATFTQTSMTYTNYFNSTLMTFTIKGKYSYLVPIKMNIETITTDVTIVVTFNVKTNKYTGTVTTGASHM